MKRFFRTLSPLCFAVLVGSCTLQDHLNPPVPNSCQVTEIMENLSYHKITPNETVTIGQLTQGPRGNFKILDIVKIGGDDYAVGGPQKHSVYGYDSQKRITKMTTSSWATDTVLIEEFAYSPGQITQTNKKRLNTSSETVVSQRVYPVNNAGLIVDDNITYENGYVVEDKTTKASNYTTKYTISNGNVVQREIFPVNISALPFASYLKYEYKYDITKANPIPNIFPFRGKINQNLHVETVNPRSASYVLEEKISYFYDSEGHIKYEVHTRENLQAPTDFLITRFVWDCSTTN